MVKSKAIFFDRDGVMNENIFYKKFNSFESPTLVKDLKIFNNIENILIKLKKHYLFFIVTNQPSYAKNKTSKKNLLEIEKKFKSLFKNRKIKFKRYFVCYNTENVNRNYCFKLDYCKYKKKKIVNKICKKPSNNLLEYAIKKYNLDRRKSWFIGDRQKDLDCARKSNIASVLINANYKNKFKYYNFQFKKTSKALQWILDENKNSR